jgi:hypothetical protein
VVAYAAACVHGAEAAAAKLPLGKVHSYEFLGTLGLRLSASGADLGARGASVVTSDVVEYRRELNLESAIATVRFQSGACMYERSVFISSPDQVLALHLNGSCAFDAVFSLSRRDGQSSVGGLVRGTAANTPSSTSLPHLLGRAISIVGSTSRDGVAFGAVLALVASQSDTPMEDEGGEDEDGGANVDTQTVDESGDDDEERRARSDLVHEWLQLLFRRELYSGRNSRDSLQRGRFGPSGLGCRKLLVLLPHNFLGTRSAGVFSVRGYRACLGVGPDISQGFRASA